jgi:ribonuclease HII
MTLTGFGVATELIPALGGVDEAGRGPLAGPVMAAVVVLHPGQIIEGVRDSKQMSAKRREFVLSKIKSESLAWALGRADVAEIDELNILQASLLAMRRAVESLGVMPSCLHIDGNRAPELPGYCGVVRTLVGGDRLCPAVAAASVVAKVHRDEEMRELDRRFPVYGFARHKGYPTSEHRLALALHGPCLVHRRSFGPVKAMLAVAGNRS